MIFNTFKLALVISGLAVAALAYSAEGSAAETDSVSEENSVKDQPAPGVQSTTSAGAPKKKEKKEGGDIFQPSEEISEDFAVSFPVDI